MPKSEKENGGKDVVMNNNSNDDSDEEVQAFLKQLDSTASASSHNSSTTLNVPGKGWSNGDIRPEMFPLTRDGKLQLYSGTRRWIGLNKGWSRVGGDEGDGTVSDQYSHRTRRSSQMTSLLTMTGTGSSFNNSNNHQLLDDEALSVRSLIAQLCEQYYKFGWATGTGGGVSIRCGGPSEQRPWRVFVAPSGIQKGTLIDISQ